MSRLLSIPVNRLVGQRFVFDPLPDPTGYIEIFEHPVRGARYGAGGDFAYGLPGRDFDAFCGIRCDVTPARQVFQAVGHWGPSADRILYAILRYYNSPLFVGERQVGLATLRRLQDDYGYENLYYEKAEDAITRKLIKKLGYHRSETDICVPNLRRAVFDRSVLLLSRPLLDQMRKTQFKPKKSIAVDDAVDNDLQIKLSGGGSPDMVMSAAYAWHACLEIPHFEEALPAIIPGTAGDIMDHKDMGLEDDEDGHDFYDDGRRRVKR